MDDSQTFKAKRLLQEQIDWPRLLDLTNRHLVTPLVFHYLDSAGLVDAVPPDILARMRHFTVANLARNMQRYAELNRILDSFTASDIPVVVLKGAALAKTVYADESLRQFGDIDVLIPRDGLARAKAIMIESGYTLLKDNYPVPDHLNEELGCEWTYYNSTTVMEIHWNLIDLKAPFNLDPPGMIERSIPLLLNDHKALALSPEDELIHLCIHQYKHHWQQLRDLCDISELLRYHDVSLDWSQTLVRSSEVGADRCLFYTLLLSKRLLDAPVPDDVISILSQRVSPGVISRSIFDLIEKSTLTFDSPHGFWPLILVKGFSAKVQLVRETFIHENNIGEGKTEEPSDKNKNILQTPTRVVLRMVRSLMAYRNLVWILFVNLSRNVSKKFPASRRRG
ncbi:MAG: nucleotidyltransferase family protein [Actinobacteria bacterium]|nr:nucleotidyltransferase family protein [Actinomycetota bacterium]